MSHCNRIDFPLVSNYVIVPMVGAATERVVSCRYFRCVESAGRPYWMPVLSTCLYTLDHDVIILRQPSVEEVHHYVPHADFEVDDTLTLFAAVAKTQDSNPGMPNLMAASGRQVSVAVYPKSTRSLILIFQRSDGHGHFGELVATIDPDVPHGSDGYAPPAPPATGG